MHSVILEMARGVRFFFLIYLVLISSVRIVVSATKTMCGMLLVVDFKQGRCISRSVRQVKGCFCKGKPEPFPD